MNKETWMAFARLAATFVCGVAALAGISLDADAVVSSVLCLATAASAVWMWWKDNRVTKRAQTIHTEGVKAVEDREG